MIRCDPEALVGRIRDAKRGVLTGRYGGAPPQMPSAPMLPVLPPNPEARLPCLIHTHIVRNRRICMHCFSLSRETMCRVTPVSILCNDTSRKEEMPTPNTAQTKTRCTGQGPCRRHCGILVLVKCVRFIKADRGWFQGNFPGVLAPVLAYGQMMGDAGRAVHPLHSCT